MEMECPVCKHKERAELDTHSDGFARDMIECGHCGALWTFKEVKTIHRELIHGATNEQYTQA